MTGLVNSAGLLSGRALMLMKRNPATLASSVVFPLLFFGLFNVVMRKVMDSRGFDYRQLLPPTIAVQAILFAAMGSAAYVAADRQSGFSARLRSLPIQAASPMIARAAGDLARSALSITVIVAVGVATGMRFRAGVIAALGFFIVALLFALAASLGMGLIGTVASSPEAAVSMASMPYLPLLMLSSGFAPVEDFPDWLEPIVRYQPVTVTIDALRALTGEGSISETVPGSVAWSLGLGLLFAFVGARRLRTAT